MSESFQANEPIIDDATPEQRKPARQPLTALRGLLLRVVRGLTVIFLGALVGLGAFYLLRLMG